MHSATSPIDAKTFATQVHVLSAQAVQRQYFQHISEALRSRAIDLASVDTQVRDLRDTIIAGDTMTPAEYDLALARIDTLMEKLPESERDHLVKFAPNWKRQKPRPRLRPERLKYCEITLSQMSTVSCWTIRD